MRGDPNIYFTFWRGVCRASHWWCIRFPAGFFPIRDPTIPGQQNRLIPQTLGEDAKRLLRKTGGAVLKLSDALGRIFNEGLGNAKDRPRFLPL